MENTVPVTECKKNCKTRKLVETCQCRDFYMNDLPEGKITAVFSQFSLMFRFVFSLSRSFILQLLQKFAT